jgi:hypothetical protein
VANLKGVTLTLLMGPIAVAPAPVAVIEALESAQVTQAVGQRSGFQLSFVYSKTSPIATTLLPTGYFDPLIRVILIATVNGVPNVLSDGPITRQDVALSDKPGQAKLTITGEDITGYMDIIDFTGFPFPAMPPFARVALMLAKYAPFGVIPVTIPALFQETPDPTDRIPHQQGTDFKYIDMLAKDAGYAFYIIPGPAPGTNTAYWGPEIRVGIPEPALTIDMDHASNIEQLSFSADGNVAEIPITHVKIAGFSVPVPVPDISLLRPPLAARPLIPKRTRLIGTERFSLPSVLMAGLSGRATDPVTGQGSLDVGRFGKPLKARGLVGVRGAGLAYDGLFYVRSVSNTLKRGGGWQQAFQLSREGLVSTLSRLPT